jgi:O-antigen ligase
MFMTKSKEINVFKFIIFAVVIITLIATPNLNKDALIIPKVIVLFLSSMYLLPYLIKNGLLKKSSRPIFLTKVLSVLIILQLVFVMINSQAPIEQQIFGRTGRGLGFITYFSLLVILLSSMVFVKKNDMVLLSNGLAMCGLVSISYAILQSFGIDFAPWDSKTNGVIGTLGNPNFVSSFTSMISIPLIISISRIKMGAKSRSVLYILSSCLLILAVYRSESTQGYVTFILAIGTFGLVYFGYKNKLISLVLTLLISFFIFVVMLGTFNKGPIASAIYKLSIESRKEFWQSAIAAINSNPIFGLGLDSFGDYSMLYRKTTVVNEYTDSAHNYFLDYAVSGGYIMAILNFLILLLTVISFFRIRRNVLKFDPVLASIFSTFVVFNAQSLISPINIPLVLWNTVICGAVIGYSDKLINSESPKNNRVIAQLRFYSVFLISLGLTIIFPYFNADRLQLKAMNEGNGDLAITAARMFPESVVRYFVLTRALMDSGLNLPALDLARDAVKFNPNSPALWALILTNSSAPTSERIEAKNRLLVLDPLNTEIKNYIITNE